MALVILAEFFASIAVIFGFLTRLAVLPLMITMAVAFFIQHSQDPFSSKELAFLFMIAFSVLLFTGPGRFSVDAIISRLFRKL